MPPRYAYWTILIDQKPTAFRAREREELLPTFHQLRRKNADVVMKWFAGGRLWESPLEAQTARRAPKAPREPRSRDWRPGGNHRDPRDRFKKRAEPPSGARPAPPRAHPKGKPPSRDHKPQPFAARDRRPAAPRNKSTQPHKPWRREAPDQRRRPEPPPQRKPPETPVSPPPDEQIVNKSDPSKRGW